MIHAAEHDPRIVGVVDYGSSIMGSEVCETISQQRGWNWPQELAKQTLALFDE